jgi:hypothetical protein
MSPRVDIGPYSSGVDATEDIADLLNAAEDLERQLEIEPGIVLRQLSQMLRRQAEFKRLQKEYDRRRQFGPQSFRGQGVEIGSG